jgi:molybdopterin-binding protein
VKLQRSGETIEAAPICMAGRALYTNGYNGVKSPAPLPTGLFTDPADANSAKISGMPLSARNQFPGKIVSIKVGAVMAEVAIDIGGGHQIISLISASSAKRLKLKKVPLPRR